MTSKRKTCANYPGYRTAHRRPGPRHGPRHHGGTRYSAARARLGPVHAGETQSLVSATLGTKLDQQHIEDIQGEYEKSYMLHYNFPPFSVGEVKRLGSVSRREVGHGHLPKWRWRPSFPTRELPYTIRVVSENPGIQRVVVHGHRVRRIAGAHGGGRACQDARRRRRQWDSSPTERATRSSPTSSAPKTTWAIWISRWQARAMASPPSRWTSRSRASRPSCCVRRWQGAQRPAAHSRRHG